MTREEAIRYFEQKKMEIQMGRSTICGYNGYDAMCSAVDALREQEGKDTKVPTNWISVEERLPGNYQTVLVYRTNLSAQGGYHSLEYIAPAFGNISQWSNDLNTWKSKVTHWMPLPDAPTEVET